MQLLRNSDSFIDAKLVLPQLFDLLLNRGVDSHIFLRGTGIFYQDILQPEFRINAKQLLQLHQNVSQLKNNADIGFLYGESLLQNPQQQLQAYLAQSQSWSQVLQRLCHYARLITPLHQPYLHKHNNKLYLYWLSSFGNNDNNLFAMQCFSGLLASLHRQLVGTKPDWTLYFQTKRPSQIELFQERFGKHYKFNALANVMVFNTDIELGSDNQSSLNQQIIEQQLEQQLAQLPAQKSLIDYIYQQLNTKHSGLDLEAMARQLEVSPATLKRYLKQHQSSYQALLDLSRSHLALYYLYCRNASNDEIAQRLNFHDSRNFRRSFKRWTGHVPSVVRAALQA